MRLFVAIELSDSVRSVLRKMQDELRPRCDDVRWVRPEQLHLMVKFLGEVPDRDIDAVAAAMKLGAAAVPFEMCIAGAGCFPPSGRVRIVWAGVEEKTGALQRCVAAVEDELVNLGFPQEERPFFPHITVGRVRDDRSHDRVRSAVSGCTLKSVRQPVDQLNLMSSVLAPQGSTYAVVMKANLGGSSP